MSHVIFLKSQSTGEGILGFKAFAAERAAAREELLLELRDEGQNSLLGRDTSSSQIGGAFRRVAGANPAGQALDAMKNIANQNSILGLEAAHQLRLEQTELNQLKYNGPVIYR